MRSPDKSLEIGTRVRVIGDSIARGIIGEIRLPADRYGRFGIVPDEPFYIRGKRGRGRAFDPLWVIPEQLEALP